MSHQSESGTTSDTPTTPEATLPEVLEHDDVDAYREFLASWDMQAVPLDQGPFKLRWVQRELPDVSVVRYSTTRALREAYVKEPGSVAIVLMLPSTSERFRVRGAEMEPMTLTLLQGGAEYEVVSPANGETLEMYVPDPLLSALGLERWLDPALVNVRPDHAAAVRLEARLGPMVTVGRKQAVLPDAARAGVLEALAATLDTVDPSTPPSPTVRLHSVYRRAIDHLEAEPDPMVTVVELASRLGVTTRTLRYAFGYALGISPYQFMLRRRMTLVRGALSDPSRAERTVLEVLLAHDITHQGEFASQYRRLFGEAPSETRARALHTRRYRPVSGRGPRRPLADG